MGLFGGAPKSQGRKNTSRPRPQKPKPPKGGSKQGEKGAPK